LVGRNEEWNKKKKGIKKTVLEEKGCVRVQLHKLVARMKK